MKILILLLARCQPGFCASLKVCFWVQNVWIIYFMQINVWLSFFSVDSSHKHLPEHWFSLPPAMHTEQTMRLCVCVLIPHLNSIVLPHCSHFKLSSSFFASQEAGIWVFILFTLRQLSIHAKVVQAANLYWRCSHKELALLRDGEKHHMVLRLVCPLP